MTLYFVQVTDADRTASGEPPTDSPPLPSPPRVRCRRSNVGTGGDRLNIFYVEVTDADRASAGNGRSRYSAEPSDYQWRAGRGGAVQLSSEAVCLRVAALDASWKTPVKVADS